MKDVHPSEYLTHLSCVNDLKTQNCNEFEPVSKLSLYSVNPASRKRYTEEERKNKTTSLKNRCDLNNLQMDSCCKPDDMTLDTVVPFLPQDFKDKFKSIKKVDGEYELCTEGDPSCVSPSSYDYCKLSSKNLKIDGNKISNVTKDCVSSMCQNGDDLSYLYDPDVKQYHELQDFEILNALKQDNVELLHKLLQNENRTTKPMKSGYGGNTILHNTIVYDAHRTFLELIKRPLSLDHQNKDGNTALHLAALKGNSIALHHLLLLGANATIKNAIGDTPLHSAVRSADYASVKQLLEQNANLQQVNRLGETPFHVALISPKKSLDVVKLLVESGSDLLEKNNNGLTALKTLEFQNKSKENEEIRTYLVNVFINKYGNDYPQMVKEYPELGNFQFINKSGREIDIKQIKNMEEAMEVKLPDQYLPDNLIYDVDKKFMKYKNLMEVEQKTKKVKVRNMPQENKKNNDVIKNALDNQPKKQDAQLDTQLNQNALDTVNEGFSNHNEPLHLEKFANQYNKFKMIRTVFLLVVVLLLLTLLYHGVSLF